MKHMVNIKIYLNDDLLASIKSLTIYKIYRDRMDAYLLDMFRDIEEESYIDVEIEMTREELKRFIKMMLELCREEEELCRESDE